MTSRRARGIATLAMAGLIGGGCGGSAGEEPAVIDPGDGGRYAPHLTAADVVDVIDNPFMPLTPGSRWRYEGSSDGEAERVEVVVTGERRSVMGIEATVVRDTVTDADGEVVEDTLDWFAQDRDGNVWYLGEESKDYEDGRVVSTEGSWEAGVDGALPGIVMPAHPTVGQVFRQEYDEGVAEDVAEVTRVGQRRAVAFAEFDDVVVTRDWNPLEPEVVEEKAYARGVGLILEITTEGGDGRIELIEHTRGAGR